MATFTADAFIQGHFTLDAYILAERWGHHRTRDHWGPESDLYVVLSSNVGKYVEGTPIHWVLSDLLDRIEQAENNNRTWDSFTTDAFLAASGTYGQGVIDIDSIMSGTASAVTFTADAAIIPGTFTVDAKVMPMFTISAFVI